MNSHPTSWISILILSSLICLGFPSGYFPPRFPTKNLYVPLLSPIYATYMAVPFSIFVHPNEVRWSVRNIKLCAMYSSPLPCYLTSLSSTIPTSNFKRYAVRFFRSSYSVLRDKRIFRSTDITNLVSLYGMFQQTFIVSRWMIGYVKITMPHTVGSIT